MALESEKLRETAINSGDADEDRSHRKQKTEPGKPPDGFLYFLWFLRNWRTYWRELSGFAIFLFFVFFLGQIGSRAAIDAIRSQFSSVTVRIIHFNHSTGELDLEFNNQLQRAVPIHSLYLTLYPTNNAPMKPLSPDLLRLCSVFDDGLMRVPSGAAVEFGPVRGKGEKKQRPVRMGVLLIRENTSFILPPGLTHTNLVPSKAAYTDICGQFSSGANLEAILHTNLIDSKGRLRVQNISLGSYVIGEHYTAIKGLPYPTDVDILRGGQLSGKTGHQILMTFSGRQPLPLLDETVLFAIVDNISPVDLFLSLGTRISGLVPVLFIKKIISYSCQLGVELETGDTLPPDSAAWVLTCDAGKTIMNVPMAFSNDWASVRLKPIPGREYAVSLTSTNWQILVAGARWARIISGTVKYVVNERTWMKVLPAEDASSSLLYSNYNVIAFQNVTNDISWTYVTNGFSLSSTPKTFLIVENQATPDLSALSTLRPSDRQNTNAQPIRGTDGSSAAVSPLPRPRP